MKDVLNSKVKFREPFRPFAPAVPAEMADRFFSPATDSAHMSFVVPVRPSRREDIAATVHVDGTSRLQTVSANSASAFHSLLLSVGRRTGTPVLLNTSFNVKGEPIVETPADAMRCFCATEMTALICEDWLIRKNGQARDANR
jgi:carbamoyltransferase